MEKQNSVPTDITRRRIIARLLGIPPALLGLASLKELVFLPERKTPLIHVELHKVLIDIPLYQKHIHVALHLHRTSHAQSLLNDINSDIQDLESVFGQAQGDLFYQVGELLVSNGLLAAKIVKDQGQFALAYAYANDAVRIAKRLEDDELEASTRYMRGCVKLEWGLGVAWKPGTSQFDEEKITSALQDFQAILNSVHAQLGAIHPQLHGFTLLQQSRAKSVLKHNITNILTLADQAGELVGRDTIDDLYTRLIVTGTLSGLHLGGYHLVRAGIFNAAGLAGKAISELNELQRLHQLTKKTYKQDETRNQAWSNIVLAEARMGLGEYTQATALARQALVVCHTINSVQNVANIRRLYEGLSASSYGSSIDVKELGDMLRLF